MGFKAFNWELFESKGYTRFKILKFDLDYSNADFFKAKPKSYKKNAKMRLKKRSKTNLYHKDEPKVET